MEYKHYYIRQSIKIQSVSMSHSPFQSIGEPSAQHLIREFAGANVYNMINFILNMRTAAMLLYDIRHALASLSRTVAREVLDPRTAMKSVPSLENYLRYSTEGTFPRRPSGYCMVPRICHEAHRPQRKSKNLRS